MLVHLINEHLEQGPKEGKLIKTNAYSCQNKWSPSLFKRLTLPENIAAASCKNATGHYGLAGLAFAAVI